MYRKTIVAASYKRHKKPTQATYEKVGCESIATNQGAVTPR